MRLCSITTVPVDPSYGQLLLTQFCKRSLDFVHIFPGQHTSFRLIYSAVRTHRLEAKQLNKSPCLYDSHWNTAEAAMNCRLRVVCVAPGSTVRGGISRLIQKIEHAFPDSIDFYVIPSCSEYIGDGQPTLRMIWKQLGQFSSCIVQVLYRAIFTRSTVFHVHFSQRGSTVRKGIICVLLRALGCKYVVQAHACEDAFVQSWVPDMAQRLLVWGLGGAHYFITLTGFWREYYVDKCGVDRDKVIVLPNPAHIPGKVPERSGRDHASFLFLGRIGTRKGTFDLIRAFAALPQCVRQQCHLTIAGDGEVDTARSLTQELGCADQVSALGWVGSEKVDQMLADADALFLPSHGEGMAMSLLEGMAWGLAIVSSPVGGANEFLVADHNCILVDPGDIGGISKAMCKLVRDPSLRVRLGAQARNTAMRFGRDQYVRELSTVYRTVADA